VDTRLHSEEICDLYSVLSIAPTSWCSGWYSCFLFSTFRIWISAQKSAVRGVSQCLLANVSKMSYTGTTASLLIHLAGFIPLHITYAVDRTSLHKLRNNVILLLDKNACRTWVGKHRESDHLERERIILKW